MYKELFGFGFYALLTGILETDIFSEVKNSGVMKLSSRLDTLFEALSVVSEGCHIYLCDLKRDYSRWSKNAVEYFGLPGEYMYNAGDIWKEHIHPDDRVEYSESIDEIFSGKSENHNMIYRSRTRDGNYVMCTCKGIVLRDEAGNPAFFGGCIKNNTVLSYTDGITGLRSLYGFMEDVEVMRSRKMSYSVLLVGMSRFSAINDVYGFNFGNDTFNSFGKLLTERMGHLGQLYKMDGTKFALISWKSDADEIAEIYSKIKNEVAHDFSVGGEKVVLSLNGGLVHVNDFNASRDTVLSCLKYTYYQSKNRKMGELKIFTSYIGNSSRRYIKMMNIIRNSVADNCRNFFLCYQPIINAKDEKLKGMEALVRWKDEDYGVVSPGKFIPILEQDTIFPELGRWIIKQAIKDSKRFVEVYPDFLIHINISYAQIERGDFISELMNILSEQNFSPRNLCLELTERCRLLDIELLKNQFKLLKQYGIKIALDDFGTGFSSIGIIRELSFDTIKVDREFVRNIDSSVTDKKTVHFIADLADAFQAEVCVEGVETDKIRVILGDFAVNSFQGYYYSEPVVMDEFSKKYLSNK